MSRIIMVYVCNDFIWFISVDLRELWPIDHLMVVLIINYLRVQFYCDLLPLLHLSVSNACFSYYFSQVSLYLCTVFGHILLNYLVVPSFVRIISHLRTSGCINLYACWISRHFNIMSVTLIQEFFPESSESLVNFQDVINFRVWL